MLNSVRFSIIENELNREEERQEFCGNNNDDDDMKSISSESSGEGIPVGFSMKSQSNDECILYDPNELEASLRALPTADKVEEIVKNNNQTYEFQGIVELSVAMLFAVWYRNLEFTASLLKQQANVNMIDGKGRTALHYACITGNGPMTRLLLHFKSKIDSWDHQYTITPLHCAALSGSFDCLLLLLKNGAQPNAGIEKKSALHYAVQKNAVKCVQCLLQFGSNPNPPQILVETPIHIASEMGYVDCLKALIDAGADVSVPAGNKKNTALHLAAEDDTVECAKILIEAGANINARNGDDQTPLHVACLAHSVETVELLIRNGADIHATYRDGRTALHASIVKETSSWDCAKILLDHKVDVNRADNFGYTPLHLAALNEFSSCAYMLIEYGADIIARTNGGVTALSFIVRRTPELIPKYLAKFDTSIRVNEHEIGDVDCEIRLDFRCLVSNYERGETELLLAFIEVGQKRILKHPLAETFLFLKWRRIRKYFLFSIFYHALYVMLFTIYSMGVFVNHCNDECHPSDTYVSIMMIIDYILLFLNVMLVGKEIFQGMHGFYLYVKNWENWLQWSIIIGVFLCAYPQGEKLKDEIDSWLFHVAGIVIFLVWLELMMLVGRFPMFGLYIQMFTKVAMNFIKFLLAYFCLLVAFALSFCILFSKYSAFENIPISILKTFVMMIGELEFQEMFFDENQDTYYPITTQLMFFVFVVLVTIILMNLLVGLAVSDIQGLQASAGLNRLTRQAELVARLEGLLFSKLLKKFPSKIFSFLRREALLRTSQYNLQLSIKPNDPREKTVPKDIIASIYKLVAERRDRNQSIRRKKRDRNMNLFKDSIDEVQYRRPPLYRNQTLRHRAVSDQSNDFQFNSPYSFSNRRSTNDLMITNIKNQVKELDTKVSQLTNKVDEIIKCITSLRRELKK